MNNAPNALKFEFTMKNNLLSCTKIETKLDPDNLQPDSRY